MICLTAFNMLSARGSDIIICRSYSFAVQLMVWGLRGVSRVILANNPLSGALILAALFWDSPWQCLLGTLGVLVSTLTALIIGQDSAEVSAGHHGFNGMLVSLLMGVFNLAGDWYWWLLLPACLGSATCVFLSSSLSSLLVRWDLPVAVFPFNLIFILYLLCTGPNNPYFPHHPAIPPGALEVNGTELSATAVLHGIPLGVGQIYACGVMGPSLLLLGAVFLYSPLLAIHAVLGSAVGTLAGLSVAVRHDSLYSGLSGFNGALGCMVVGGLFFTFNWRTHLFAIACGCRDSNNIHFTIKIWSLFLVCCSLFHLATSRITGVLSMMLNNLIAVFSLFLTLMQKISNPVSCAL
uniref:Si:dkey-183c6.7 n=1 Tax=Sphaeramia orbicularis TaxID=375764 RepID=A0A673CH52_9TELE